MNDMKKNKKNAKCSEILNEIYVKKINFENLQMKFTKKKV